MEAHLEKKALPTEYDLIGRPTNATDSVSLFREWLYNPRSELAAATISTNCYGYAYDAIGNRLWAAANAATNSYSANSLNQYTSILCASVPLCEPSYDADGNLLADGAFSYAYDAENRLVSATSAALTNGAIRVLNDYDHKHRRVRKTVQRLLSTVPPPPSPPVGEYEWETLETHTFVYDGNNIVLETVASTNGATNVREYFWGMDKSGSEQGAGGVGGLLAVSIDGEFHFPCYDHNGNIVRYITETGVIVAQYTYDPYGCVIEESGPHADLFSFGFSTKYHDRETGLISYLMRFNHSPHGRWLNRDPIGEEGGFNLYAFASNSPSFETDALGLSTYNIIDLLHDQMCEDAYRKIRSYLNTAQELAAWDRYTNHDGGRRFRDIELSPSDVKLIAESMGTVVSHVQAKRGACRQSVSFSETKSIGGSAPSPWIKAIGGVSIKVSTSCSNGCFSYEYNISDLYDFDTKGFSGFKSRGFWGQVGTIGVNWTQTCLRCDWQTFYHKGTYYGK